jgi:hypothetical protein
MMIWVFGKYLLFHLPTKKYVNPADEFRIYCDDNNRLRGSDILGWWKLNSNNYPNLSRMAKDYLAIPGTSTSSERLFSSGKHLIADTRKSLSPSTIRACQCLKSWEKWEI